MSHNRRLTHNLMEGTMGTDNGSPSSTGHEHEGTLAERINSTSQKDLAIQIENDVIASVDNIYRDYDESISLIPRVPESLREGSNGAYDPQVVSIGPYHWGKPQLEAMEIHKRRYLVEFLNRFPGRCLHDYIKEIEPLEVQLRNCYDKDVHKITKKEFVEMMLVDGCFVVEYCLKVSEGVLEGVLEGVKHDPGQKWLLFVMRQDIWCVLENQLPFFLLQRIYDIATNNTKENLKCPSSFIQAAFELLGIQIREYVEHVKTPITMKNQLLKTSIHHFIHLNHSILTSCYSRKEPIFNIPRPEPSCLRRACTRLDQTLLHQMSSPTMIVAYSSLRLRLHKMFASDVSTRSENIGTIYTIPSATELHDLGIKFKVSKSKKPYYIKFHRGVMEIQQLYLNNWRAILILNQVAFERLNFERKAYIIQYFMFMDLLVNTSKDVALLRTYDIIHHDLGSDEEVALFFSRLMKRILSCPLVISTIMYDEVNEYCRRRRHRWRASLIRDYFSSPWSTLGLVVGFILLALTFVQSYMSLHSYFLPPQS